MNADKHYLHSSYREMLLEYLFVSEIMRKLWIRDLPKMEVLKSQVDDSGYDLVLESNKVSRHVQLKASFQGASTKKVNVNLRLADKPSGCVIWMEFDPDTLALGPFFWFGDLPGKPLPDIRDLRVAKHPKGDSSGTKAERPNIRQISKSRFTRIEDTDGLITHLFGRLTE